VGVGAPLHENAHPAVKSKGLTSSRVHRVRRGSRADRASRAPVASEQSYLALSTSGSIARAATPSISDAGRADALVLAASSSQGPFIWSPSSRPDSSAAVGSGPWNTKTWSPEVESARPPPVTVPALSPLGPETARGDITARNVVPHG
jgi:hypothetical protein